MIKIVQKRNENFHVKILHDTKEFKDFALSFKGNVYSETTKTLVFGGKQEYDIEEIMELFATIYKTLSKMKVIKASIDLEGFNETDMYAIVMGIVLSTYNYKGNTNKVEIELLCEDCDIQEYITLANNINIAKHLSNSPANIITPQAIVDFAYDTFKDDSVKITVLDDTTIYQKNMMGLYSVGMGSTRRPCLLVLKYIPRQTDKEILAMIGKGVTFDTGGYNLKPTSAITGMQGDMGGAASVLAIFKTAVEQQLDKNIIAVIPLCENKISSDSLLPSDIITLYDGTTVEIGNTDAEGRLILADAITYAITDENATTILDMATLTGAAEAAFGHTITPIVSTSQELINTLNTVSKYTGEKFIAMPYYKEHQKMLESHVADMKNIGGPKCGVITSSVFLKHFAKDVPWMHFDIAGTHWSDVVMYDYHQKGAICGAVATVYYMVKEHAR